MHAELVHCFDDRLLHDLVAFARDGLVALGDNRTLDMLLTKIGTVKQGHWAPLIETAHAFGSPSSSVEWRNGTVPPLQLRSL